MRREEDWKEVVRKSSAQQSSQSTPMECRKVQEPEHTISRVILSRRKQASALVDSDVDVLTMLPKHRVNKATNSKRSSSVITVAHSAMSQQLVTSLTGYSTTAPRPAFPVCCRFRKSGRSMMIPSSCGHKSICRHRSGRSQNIRIVIYFP